MAGTEKTEFTRRELYERVWSVPMVKLAKEFRISDRGLAKICERNGIPVPPRGYWAKKAAGKRVARVPLLEVTDQEASAEIRISLPPKRAMLQGTGEEEASLSNRFRELFDAELANGPPIKIPGTLRNPHHLIAKWLEDDRRYRDTWKGYGYAPTARMSSLERRRLDPPPFHWSTL